MCSASPAWIWHALLLTLLPYSPPSPTSFLLFLHFLVGLVYPSRFVVIFVYGTFPCLIYFLLKAGGRCRQKPKRGDCFDKNQLAGKSGWCFCLSAQTKSVPLPDSFARSRALGQTVSFYINFPKSGGRELALTPTISNKPTTNDRVFLWFHTQKFIWNLVLDLSFELGLLRGFFCIRYFQRSLANMYWVMIRDFDCIERFFWYSAWTWLNCNASVVNLLCMESLLKFFKYN